ncbi:hypothetical protein [Streptomyces prunicolor]
MADDDTGGTLHPFPGLRIPGAVADDPPPASGGFPALAPVAALAPPASLSVAGAPSLSGGTAPGATTAHHDPGLTGDSDSSGQGVGAMSVVMMAGITVAAMRGAYHVAAYLKARHEHHRAIADQQNAAAGKSGLELEVARIKANAERQKWRIQSGPEFGRSSRNSSGSAGRSNSGKNSVPASLRSGSGSNRPASGGTKAPGKGSGGGSGGRSGGSGTPGQSAGSRGRKGPLDGSGGRSSTNRNSGAPDRSSGRVRTGSGGSNGDRGPSLRAAARQRAADRIRNGPATRSGGGNSGTPGSSSGGPGKKPSGAGTKPGSSSKSPKSGTKGSAPKSGSPSGTGTGRTTLPQAIATEAGRRLTKRRKNVRPVISKPRKAKKPRKKASTTAPGGTKVSLTKKPKVDLTKTPRPPKVDLTKKPRPPKISLTKKPRVNLRKKTRVNLTKKPRVNLRKKTRVNLRKKPRVNLRNKRTRVNLKKRPGTKGSGSGPGSGKTGGTGKTRPKVKRWWRRDPNKGRGARERWERAGARRSGRGPGDASGTDGSFGPPPGWGHSQDTVTTVLERIDGGPHRPRPAPAQRSSVSTKRIPVALPAGRRTGASVSSTGIVPVPRRAPNTQYADSDLTIYDVIDSDADMAEEIMQGADDALEAAEGCDKLTTRLEFLHAKIMDLKVPGVLEGWVLLLAEKAQNVKARAEAVAEKLPAASEAIRVAGENAAERHKELADVTRDQGHAAPAEAEYHNE